jgi:hypothetical protein
MIPVNMVGNGNVSTEARHNSTIMKLDAQLLCFMTGIIISIDSEDIQHIYSHYSHAFFNNSENHNHLALWLGDTNFSLLTIFTQLQNTPCITSRLDTIWFSHTYASQSITITSHSDGILAFSESRTI